MPEISCMCLRFFSLSFRMKEITVEGMSAKAIETMKDIKKPLAVAALYLNF